MARQLSGISKAYLIVYNGILTVGWAYVLALAAIKYSQTKDHTQLWSTIEFPLKIFQTAAILEVVHAIVGIVPSNIFLTFFQVASRVFLLWGILHQSPPSQVSIGVPIFLLAWCITEIIRYGYYVLHLVEHSSLIQWFRYSLFIVLYPMGLIGEVLCICHALSNVRENPIWTIQLPNNFNVASDYQYYFLIGAMLSYIPIFPLLYCHMFAQRRKIVGGGGGPSKKSE